MQTTLPVAEDLSDAWLPELPLPTLGNPSFASLRTLVDNEIACALATLASVGVWHGFLTSASRNAIRRSWQADHLDLARCKSAADAADIFQRQVSSAVDSGDIDDTDPIIYDATILHAAAQSVLASVLRLHEAEQAEVSELRREVAMYRRRGHPTTFNRFPSMKTTIPYEDFANEQLAAELAALKEEGRSLTEHPLAVAVLDRQAEAGAADSSEELKGLLVADAAEPPQQAVALLAAAGALGLGYKAAQRLGGGKVFDFSIPGANSPELQGMVEGLSAPIKIAALYSPVIPTAVMNGIAAQAGSAVAGAESSGAQIDQTTAAAIEGVVNKEQAATLASAQLVADEEARKAGEDEPVEDGLPVEGAAPKQLSAMMRSLLGLGMTKQK